MVEHGERDQAEKTLKSRSLSAKKYQEIIEKNKRPPPQKMPQRMQKLMK